MTSLAVAWTRPETVRADIARVLAMAGFEAGHAEDVAVIDAAGGGRGPGEAPSPWLAAGAVEALAADGDDAPARRISMDTRTVLHLVAARVDSRLGVGTCLAALAAAADRAGAPDIDRDADRKADRDGDSGAGEMVAAARRTLADGRTHGFLIDATLVPGGRRPGSALQMSNLLLAGRDPVALDAAVARILGLDPRSLPLLSCAETAGLGRRSPEPADQAGDVTDLSRRSLVPWRPETEGLAARLSRRLLGDRRRRTAPDDTPWHALWRDLSEGV